MVKTGFRILLTTLLLGAVHGFSQSPAPTPPLPAQMPSPNITEPNPRRPAPTIDGRAVLGTEEDYLTGSRRLLSPVEISEAAKEKVRVTREEKALYKDLRKAHDLKLLKIYAAPPCAENKRVLNAADAECAAAADLLRVSFYSFLIGYYGEAINDFRVLEDDLIAGNGGYVHGFLTDLGAADIGQVIKESTAVAALKDFPAARTSAEETKQRGALEKGFSYQNLQIAARQKLRAGHVYLLRLVSYSSKSDPPSVYNKDAVYVLQVGAVNEARVATILWRKLFEKDAPRLKNE